MNYTLYQSQLENYSANIRKEWAITNGLGGYAGLSVLDAPSRTHHGYLIASLHPPVERFLVLSRTSESITLSNQTVSLETAQHGGELLNEDGFRRPIISNALSHFKEFSYDGNAHFTYEACGVTLRKGVGLIYQENTCVIDYEVINANDEPVTLHITPLFNYREHSTNATCDSLKFTTEEANQTISLIPEANSDVRIMFQYSEGVCHKRKESYESFAQLPIEIDLETPGIDSHYCPYDVTISIPAHTTKRISCKCSLVSPEAAPTQMDSTGLLSADYAQQELHKRIVRLRSLIANAGYTDDFTNQLIAAADQFLAYRQSTELTTVLAGLPWFTDWGRDTMIAFSGLTLVPKRFSEARDILTTFHRYIHHGMVPNMFPDNGLAPLYNTVDASLWYFYAIHQYLRYDNSKEAQAFVKSELYPGLKEILTAYENGTDFSIYMEEDGLLHAGSGVDQVTWMDVRVGDWVPTPRHGSPVEINALWYNALRIMEKLSNDFAEDSSHYTFLADKVYAAYAKRFWNAERNCLYDVLTVTGPDDSLRPNQIYAVSLPYSLLSKEQEKAVVDTVYQELFVGCGLRSLSRDHKDYHPIYCGSLPKRDAAYHQGTAWGFLLGGFLSAYMKVYGHSQAVAQQADSMLDAIRAHLYEGCIGSIAEIFDGDAPHIGRGCYAQAWSVGEVLRAYTEDILPYL